MTTYDSHFEVDARHYLKGDGTVESGTQVDAFLAAVDNGPKVGYFPPGSYVLPEGKSLPVKSGRVFYGHSAQTSSISTKNAYVFTTNGTQAGYGNAISLRNLGLGLTADSTSGGVIHFIGGEQGSLYFIDEVWGGSGAGANCRDPLVKMEGWIEGWIRGGMFTNGGGDAIYCTAGSWFLNRVEIAPLRIQSYGAEVGTHAAIHIDGGSHVDIHPQVIESYSGMGVWMNGTNWGRIWGIWFEDIYDTYIRLDSTAGIDVSGNKLQGPHGLPAGNEDADGIALTAAQYSRGHNHIVNNSAQDGTNSGVIVRIGTNVEFTVVMNNRNASLGAGSIVDDGIASIILGNDTGNWGEADDAKLGNPKIASWRVVPPTETLGVSAFSVGNPAGTNWFTVNTSGFPTFHTSDLTKILTEGELATDGFAFFWDEAAGKVKVRVRNHAGAYATYDVT